MNTFSYLLSVLSCFISFLLLHNKKQCYNNSCFQQFFLCKVCPFLSGTIRLACKCHAAKAAKSNSHSVIILYPVFLCLPSQPLMLNVVKCSLCFSLPLLLSLSSLPISIKPMWREWWTWSLLTSVSHQLQPHCVLHLSAPYEAFTQQTILLWWAVNTFTFHAFSLCYVKI